MSGETTRPAWGEVGQWRRAYITGLLCAIAVSNYVDRQIMGILLQPIKEEFHASDTVMGLLLSTVFAVFFLAAAIPVGRLADRYPRKAVLGVCVIVWSAMTSLGGFAANVWQLGATRVGVAVAEAGGMPTSYSMISDLFPVRSRGTAISIVGASQSLGVGLGTFLGGWLTDAMSWRASFFVVGAVGILLGLAFLLTTKEPPRGQADRIVDTGVTPPLRTALSGLWRIRTYRHLVMIVGWGGFCGYGTLSWGPTFLRRVHDLSGTEVGTWFGLLVAISLMTGALASGIVGDWLGRRDLRGYMWVGAVGPLLALPFGLLFALAPSLPLALVGMVGFFILFTLHSPVCYIVAVMLAPLRIRATASVVLAIGNGVMGLMLSPLVMGALNDALTPRFGEGAIRYGFVVAIVLGALAPLHALLAARTIRQDAAAAHEGAQAQPA